MWNVKYRQLNENDDVGDNINHVDNILLSSFFRSQPVIIGMKYGMNLENYVWNWSNWGMRFWISPNWLGSIDYVYVIVYE